MVPMKYTCPLIDLPSGPEKEEERQIRAYRREVRAYERKKLKYERMKRAIERKKLAIAKLKRLPELLRRIPRSQWPSAIVHSINAGTLTQHKCIHGCAICHFIGWVGTVSEGYGEYYTTREYGERIGKSHTWVQHLCNEAELPYFKINGRRYIVDNGNS
jgi:hypothetical protein